MRFLPLKRKETAIRRPPSGKLCFEENAPTKTGDFFRDGAEGTAKPTARSRSAEGSRRRRCASTRECNLKGTLRIYPLTSIVAIHCRRRGLGRFVHSFATSDYVSLIDSILTRQKCSNRPNLQWQNRVAGKSARTKTHSPVHASPFGELESARQDTVVRDVASSVMPITERALFIFRRISSPSAFQTNLFGRSLQTPM